MAEMKIVNVPEDLKRHLNSEAALRGMTTSKLVVESLERCFPKLEARKK
jgi:plasmid stability protein